MKKLIWLAILLPTFANAQWVNGVIQRNGSNGSVRYLQGANIDTLAKKSDLIPGLQDSLSAKANRTFDNVASGAIDSSKILAPNGMLYGSSGVLKGNSLMTFENDSTVTYRGIPFFQNISTQQFSDTIPSLFLGYNAGAQFGQGLQGYANTGVGFRSGQSLKSNTASEASSNSLFGHGSGSQLTTGSFNTIVGTQAGANATTIKGLTAVGWHAGLLASAGDYAVAIGTSTLRSNSANSQHVAIGHEALYSNTSGVRNTGGGYRGLYGVTTGNYNTSWGWQSFGSSSYNGDYSVAMGYDAGRSNSGAGYSVFIGAGAGTSSGNSHSAVNIGYYAGTSSTGDSLVNIGRDALAVGDISNVINIGANTTSSADNRLNIGNMIYGNGVGTTQRTINQVGIGVSSPTAVMHLKAGSATANTAPLKFNSGTLLTNPEAGAMEFSDSLYFTPSATRRALAYNADVVARLPLSAGSSYPLTGSVYFTRNGQLSQGAPSTSTSQAYHNLTNAGNITYWGIERSTGNGIISGAPAYSTVIGTASNRSVVLATNGEARYEITGAGNHDFKSGTGTFGGALTAPSIKLTTGANNGYVLTSDASGNGSWQPSSTGMTYKGAWNASANTPTLADGTGTLGDTYTVSTGGTQFGRTFVAGGQAIYNGSIWQNVGTSSAVSSVNGATGVVQINPSLSTNTLSLTGGTASVDLSTLPAITAKQDAISGTGLVKSTSGTISYVTDNSTNWNTAYSQTRQWDGGSTGLNMATGRTSLGGTTVGQNLFTLTNPSAERFIRINADNTVSALNANTMLGAIGGYPNSNPNGYTSNSGTVTSVAAGNGLNFTTITGSGSVTLGTPGSVTLASTNSVTTNSHTHAFTPGGTSSQYIRGDGSLATFPSIPAGTVTSVGISGSNGIGVSSSPVTTSGTIALSLGAITPTSVAASGTVTGSNLSGTNTGDQTNITGNAGTATKLATARTIAGVSFDGTANISLNNNAITNGAGYITSSALSPYAPIASPALTGNPTAPTQTQGDNSTKIATTAYVDEAVSSGSGTSGTYTPTITNGTNVSSSTAQKAQWIRVGNNVTIFGKISITTGAGTTTNFKISLPSGLSSNFTNSNQSNGFGTTSWLALDNSLKIENYYVSADITGDIIEFSGISIDSRSRTIWYSLTYEIL